MSPMYNFSCLNCDYEDEIYLHMNQRNTIRNCPKCIHILQRKIGTGKLLNFKGKGWTKEGIQ